MSTVGLNILAAAGDTWGISGPDFLKIYGGTLAGFLVVAVLLRIRATREDGADSPNSASPGQIALLQGGSTRAVYASLAGLRAAGLVAAGQRRELQVTEPVPVGLSRLDHAVYDAAARRVQVSGLQDDPGVRSAIDELQGGVVRAGWILDPEQRSRARLGGWLLLALAGAGVVRLVAGIANGRPVGNLILLTLLTVVPGVLLMVVPRLSASGKRALAQTRKAHAHLAPNQSPAWATYGMGGAAMGVALFGTSALWAADPAFAGEAGIKKEAFSSSGSSGDGGGSGGGGGGGGGGGCGGGGCGG